MQVGKMEKKSSQDIQVRDKANSSSDKMTQQTNKSKPNAKIIMMSKPESTSNKTQAKLAATLLSAATEGKVELVRLLLRGGADVNAQDEQFGNTALHQAAWNGFSETIQVLCKYRAYTSIKNKAQFTPLHMACQQGHNQSARLLLMAQAKTEAKNSYGDTPLHTATRYGHAGVARILLSAKCDPNQVNKNHDTPLHIAAAMGRRKLTKIFMQNGAEPAIKNKQYETAMDIALRKDLIDIQELISNPPPVKSASSRHRKDVSHTRRHKRLQVRDLSSDDDDDENEDDYDEYDEVEAEHSRGRLTKHSELAVDVPAHLAADWKQQTAKNKLVNKNNGLQAPNRLCPTPRANRPQRNTLNGAQSDLHLLTSVLARQRLSDPRGQRADSADGACPPDVRPAAHPSVVEAPLGGQSKSQPQLLLLPRQRVSPTGSLRSSLSKSRGRLLARRRLSVGGAKRVNAGGQLMLVRRPNLGTCVGKLSLLRLRSMVDQRRVAGSTEGDAKVGEPKQVTSRTSLVIDGATKPATGRRQERQRQQQAQPLPRALNGIKLLTTRPLASLSDETQLYAIPKKSKVAGAAESQPANQETADKSKNCDELDQNGCPVNSANIRVASGGPALTSDGGHTSSGSADCSSAGPSSSSSLMALPSSEDDCVRLVEKEDQKGEQQAQAVEKRPALVGVHADSDLYLPGYSVVGEPTQRQEADASDQACLGRAPAGEGTETGGLREPTAETSSGDKPEPAKVSSGSRLRQLLHLDSQNGGKTPSENKRIPISAIAGGYYAYSPAEPPNKQQQQQLLQESKPAKKSWLMSKFSLSSGNLASKPEVSQQQEEQQVAAKRPEVEQQESPIGENQQVGDNERHLIRPKSALSATSADLIAAQKSLAAAAAAKVRRDRLFKLSSGEQSEPVAGKQAATILTVKTSEPPSFWHHHHPMHLHHRQVSNGANMIGTAGANEHKFVAMGGSAGQRSGTNSAGMSDSSPSNNGAESDNSIQTTTGSLNTDNTSGGQPTSDQASAASVGPSSLGILSRILLNNKSLAADSSGSSASSGTLRHAAGKQSIGHQATKMQHNASSLSSALSSPCSASNKSSTDVNNTRLLDQLASRSRQPIVLTKSNELAGGEEQPATNDDLAPRLPPKSALKQTPVTTQLQVSPDQMINGLPRVASYGHLNHPSSYQLNGLYQKSANDQTLCNYHALNHRGSFVHPYQPPYLPYSPFDLQLSSTGHYDLGRTKQQPVDLSSSLTSNSAINYEYYLDPAGHYGGRYPTAYNTPSYTAEGYLPDNPFYINSKHRSYLRDNCLSHNGAHYADLIHAPIQRPVRPKSSIDTYLLSSAHNNNNNNDHHNHPDGRPRLTSATTNSSHLQQSKAEGFKPASIASYYANAAAYGGAYLYHQHSNSIYAGDQGANNFHHNSDLTVLPTTSVITTITSQGASGQGAELLDKQQVANGCSELAKGGQVAEQATAKTTVQLNSAKRSWTSDSSPPIATTATTTTTTTSSAVPAFKSLVQVNQSTVCSSSPAKSNQSSVVISGQTALTPSSCYVNGSSKTLLEVKLSNGDQVQDEDDEDHDLLEQNAQQI